MRMRTGAAINPWRVFRADPAEWYSTDEMARSERYTRPLRRVNRLRSGLVLAATVAVVGSHAGPALLERWGIGSWFLQLAVVTALLHVVETVIVTPFSAWRELRYDRRWGFSTQTVRGFVVDAVKGIPLGFGLMLLVLTPLWAVVRATPWWWLWGWAVFAFLIVGIGLLFPVVIAPLFNKYTPLEDGELRTEILAMAARMGADIRQVLVEDSSKRDTRPNAYVAGIGRVRRVVLYDNMLRYPKDAVLSVIAHEIGHWKLRHIWRQVPLALVATFVSFVVLKLVLESSVVLRFAGVDSLASPAASLVFQLGFFTLLSQVIGLPMAWLSRAYERQADLFGLETVGRADELVGFFRDVSLEVRAELRPSWWQRLRASHPPFAERMAMATAWSASTPGWGDQAQAMQPRSA
jgi:STE24 endopeptidase